jgi:hypothetical protein
LQLHGKTRSELKRRPKFFSDRIRLAPQQETQLRKRKIQALINVLQPDLKYHSVCPSDETSALDISDAGAAVLGARLEFAIWRASMAGRAGCRECVVRRSSAFSFSTERV